MLWTQRRTKGYRNVKVTNFTSSWRDGLAFASLIHKHRPDLIDFDSMSRDTAKENLETTFNVAEEKLGIPKLVDFLNEASVKCDKIHSNGHSIIIIKRFRRTDKKLIVLF